MADISRKTSDLGVRAQRSYALEHKVNLLRALTFTVQERTAALNYHIITTFTDC